MKILKFIKANQFQIFISFLILFLYLLKLKHFPIFADETIYINWANRIIKGFEGPFISLNDGKPPLFIWMISIWSIIFPNLFFAGRFASVFIFFLFLVFILFFYKKYHSQSYGIISALILSLSPFILFHARMSLMDSSLAIFLSIAIIFWLTPKLKYNYILSGVFFGLAYWTKTPAIFLLPFPLISNIIFVRKKDSFKKSFISIIISLLIISILRVSVFFPQLFSRSQDFTFTVSQMLNGETIHIWNNLKDLIIWIISYNSYPFLIALVFSILSSLKNKNHYNLNLLIASIVFLFPFIVFGKITSPRYYLPAIFLLTLIVGNTISNLKNKSIQTILVIFILIIPIFKNYQLYSDYLKFSFPKKDEYQYLKHWSSGIGISQTMQYFENIAKDQKITIISEGYFGTTPDGLYIYQENFSDIAKNNTQIIPAGSTETHQFKEALEKKVNKNSKIYYVGNSQRISPQSVDFYHMKLIKSFSKKDNYQDFQIYEIPRN